MFIKNEFNTKIIYTYTDTHTDAHHRHAMLGLRSKTNGIY